MFAYEWRDLMAGMLYGKSKLTEHLGVSAAPGWWDLAGPEDSERIIRTREGMIGKRRIHHRPAATRVY